MPGLATMPGDEALSLRWSNMLSDALADLAWSSDGSLLYAGSVDKHRALRCSRRPSTVWQAHDAGITRLAIKPGDDDTLASTGEDGHVILWDSRSGERRALLADEGGWVELLAWTPDGKVLAAAASKTLSIWRGESLWDSGTTCSCILAMDWAPIVAAWRQPPIRACTFGAWMTTGRAVLNPCNCSVTRAHPYRSPGTMRRALAVGTQDSFLQVWRQAVGSKGPHATGKASQLTMRGYPGKVTCLAWHQPIC